jgi:dienelactone hydrolase
VTEVLLFHHAQGLTDGCRSFATRLTAGGHDVHTPDLYDGRTFPDLTAGIAYAEQTGFDTIIDRGRAAAEGLPAQIVYVGLSLGVLPAQMLAQTRPGALGAAFVSAAVPPSEFGGPWPGTVPLQIHMMDEDPVVTGDGDLAVAREITELTDGASLYLYRGDRHLFVDASLPDYDHAATELVVERIVDMLGRAG